ncbi:MAG: FAD-binding oxidoreductase [Bacteroidetes bacterium HGW-Bacteroidetes-16]|jgi:FAD/FMN-containing dehydrogenase/Fe-S oxidoreductase|nr:MAG: FAD-binding oxidoreductase [Bacteroidetes bacterium HGW-Bacteroidetes-16]
MNITPLHQALRLFAPSLQGEVMTDDSIRLIYATDASAYREIPIGVVYPANTDDIKKLIAFCRENNTSLIPRTAGTSLAGQVVGGGIIADVSRHMTQILEVNKKEKWVRVQPGVILDELNVFLKPMGLFFGPETSTANRCMMGGMVGNNACGAHSLIYGSTRDHTLELHTILSDGSEVVFGAVTKDEFNKKCDLFTLEGSIYRLFREMLGDSKNQEEIIREFPDPQLERRNTGYAIDLLLRNELFGQEKTPFNMTRLLAGSEGTLAFTTEIKLNLVDLPPIHKALVCVHFNTIAESLKANLIALKFNPVAIELMDKIVLDLTKKNIEQEKNRFFVEGDPGAILVVEFAGESTKEIHQKAADMENAMRQAEYGYYFPMVEGADIKRVWDLRKAGLGIINNLPGDAKPAPVIEDTAVNPEVLPAYIEEFDAMLKKFGKECVYYAHVATGELHLRPILNLKDPHDVELFYEIALETAKLVKKYRGSLSGEHGDGRLRGQFIPLMVGDHNYSLFKQIKQTWDPQGIFNPGKIVDTPVMNTSLRNVPGVPTREIKTTFDFSKDLGILRAAEKCNGTAVCRKTEITGGTMCPSYMASRDEYQTTRARANVLREFLTTSKKANPFDHQEIYQVMDLCLSCKACKSECPASVDVAKLKAEFLQQYYASHHIPLRTLMIAHISKINTLGSHFTWIYNFVNSNKFISGMTARLVGFAPERHFPLLYKTTLDRWQKKYSQTQKQTFRNGRVYLFNDEFTRFNDTEIGIKAIKLLTTLGYEVVIPDHLESARTYLSKGMVKRAKKIANANIEKLQSLITDETPLVGIEPSAILTFRDEYKELADQPLKEAANSLAGNALMIDEFLQREVKKGKITQSQFTTETKEIKLHGHCHQKALASTSPTLFMLNFPRNYQATEIPSGCCGMAGSFGFEKEHYDLSMKIGELVLFPAVRVSSATTLIAAPGTSCRHQIKDGTSRTAYHPVEILYDALSK